MPWSSAGGKNQTFDIDEEDREAWLAAVQLTNDLKDLSLKERLNHLASGKGSNQSSEEEEDVIDSCEVKTDE